MHHRPPPAESLCQCGKHIDEMPAQTAAANHQNTFALKQLAFRFAQGGDIARISGIHRSATSHRGKQSHDIPVLHFRFRLVMKTVDEQNRHFFLGNVHPVKVISAQAIPSGDSSVTLSLPWRKVAKTRTSIMKILLCKEIGEGTCPSPLIILYHLPTHSSRPSFFRVSSVGNALTQPRAS